ncbi:MAG: ComEA family DNA-binding protein, partial [Rhodocyclales bacterium]|nr:ComEA family DNA-binding protein [Rhodocyclales bacterium]
MPARALSLLSALLLWSGLACAQLDINAASAEQLDGLKGIGPAKAQAIVDYRRQHGRFNSVDELAEVPGLGPKIVDGFRRDVTVGPAGRALAPARGDAPRSTLGTRMAPPAPAMPANPARPASPPPIFIPSQPAASAPARPTIASPAAPARPAMPAPAAPAKPMAVPPAKPSVSPPPPMESARPAAPPPARPAMPRPAG